MNATPLFTPRHDRHGFTLIELLVVVVVIGIVAAIGVPKFANSKTKGYITAMKSDLRNLINAEEQFFSDSARYTNNLASLGFKMTAGVNAPSITVLPGAWKATVTHSQLSSVQCAIGVNTTNPLWAGAGEGEAACK